MNKLKLNLLKTAQLVHKYIINTAKLLSFYDITFTNSVTSIKSLHILQGQLLHFQFFKSKDFSLSLLIFIAMFVFLYVQMQACRQMARDFLRTPQDTLKIYFRCAAITHLEDKYSAPLRVSQMVSTGWGKLGHYRYTKVTIVNMLLLPQSGAFSFTLD